MVGIHDHRPRVAEQRRRKMRQRLIEAAIRVFAKRGPEAAVIEDVIDEARVARGTFYNHFRSIDALLEAAKNELGREMMHMVAHAWKERDPDPALRLAMGLKAFIDVAVRYPLYLDFLTRLGMRGIGPGTYLREVTPEFLQDGVVSGRFRKVPKDMALDILEASTVVTLCRLRAGEPVDIDAFVEAMMGMLGLDREAAQQLASRPLVPLCVPDDSLISRSDALRAAE